MFGEKPTFPIPETSRIAPSFERADHMAHALLAALSFSHDRPEISQSKSPHGNPVELFGHAYVDLLAHEPERLELLVKVAARVASPDRYKTTSVEDVAIRDEQTKLRVQCENYYAAIKQALPKSLHYADYLLAQSNLESI